MILHLSPEDIVRLYTSDKIVTDRGRRFEKTSTLTRSIRAYLHRKKILDEDAARWTPGQKQYANRPIGSIIAYLVKNDMPQDDRVEWTPVSTKEQTEYLWLTTEDTADDFVEPVDDTPSDDEEGFTVVKKRTQNRRSPRSEDRWQEPVATDNRFGVLVGEDSEPEW